MNRAPISKMAIALTAIALSLCLVAPAQASPKAQSSVIGGGPAGSGWAFTASIHEDGRFICTGSVVSPTVVARPLIVLVLARPS